MANIAALIILCTLHSPVALGGSSPKIVTAVRAENAPVLDGLVNDAVWQQAPTLTDFTQFDPEEGTPPSEQTSVRILYDDNALYIGVICYDSQPSGIVRQLTRRDRSTEADRFTVMIDSYHDLQTAFVFSCNVSGVQSDGVLSQDGTVYDLTWDAVWSVEASLIPDGWSAEFRIPFNALRFSREDGEYVWGANFRRYISRKRETVEWVMVPRSETLQISRWGKLTGITGIDPPIHLSLAPHVSVRSSFQTATAARSSSSDHEGFGGLDIKYGLSQNFTLDAAVNPDFGQVEVDQAVLNLTVFETRFPEKRPFFIEGSQIFTFGSSIDNTTLPLFFSRRIGKRPTGSAGITSPAGGKVESNPLATTILGAAKVTGRTQSGFSLGVIASATDEEEAVVRSATGERTEIRTEPRGTYNVARVKQEFAGGSWVGGLATGVARENMLPAYSGGIDWNIRLDDRTYTLDGYVAGAKSSARVGMRDGAAGRVLFSKISAEHWFYTTAYDFSTENFNTNDIGFFAQPRDHGGYVQLLYRENFAGGIFRRYSFAFNPEYRWNWDGVLTHSVVNNTAAAEFRNYWFATLNYALKAPAHDDADRGIVGTYRRPFGHQFQLSVRTDERQSLSANFIGAYEFDAKRKQTFYAYLAVKARPAPWVELEPLVFYQRTRDDEAWLFPDGNIIDPNVGPARFSVFGDRDLDELDFALRGIITFTRELSLQFYSQVLLARGRYDNYKRLVSSRELVAYDYPSHPAYYSHDFNAVTFNANVLLRWEYLPGSTIYLVWTQGRFDNIANYMRGFGSRFRDTFTLPHEDILLLKVSYWFSL
jgi:hypothetical protein